MREYGGYIEFETFLGEMLYEDGIALNCGRNALEYLCEVKKIRKLYIPYFLCASIPNLCKKIGVKYEYYSISEEFKPLFDRTLGNDEWLYIVNYYGQLSMVVLEELKKKYIRIIIDNTQNYFQMPVRNVDTFYSCRKYFGVADGAILYTDTLIDRELPLDESFERMGFLLGRFERTANEFYLQYKANNKLFASEPLKRMSKLTRNILHGVDYERVKKVRTDNFTYFHVKFENVNRLHLTVPEGAFMYPLYIENGVAVREELQKNRIYIPTLWPEVFDICNETYLEHNLAKNILPLPVDQRYGEDDMEYLYTEIMRCIRE